MKPVGDILVLAGDIGYLNDDNFNKHPFWNYVSDNYLQVIVVVGNHELYKFYDLALIPQGLVCSIRKNVKCYYNTVIHISLNPHPDDKLTDEQLTEIGQKYMERLGYGSQPYMIFKHEDIDRQHIHIVSTRVRPYGSLVPENFEKERSNKIRRELVKEYNLIPAKGQKQGEAWQLAPVNVSQGNLKKQVANVINPLPINNRNPVILRSMMQ